MTLKSRMLLLLMISLLPSGIWAQVRIAKADIAFTFVSKNVEGTISGFNSSSTIDLEQNKNSKFKGSVAVETLKTGNFLRDWSLKGRKYFDADAYPLISFESSSVEVTTNGFEVSGTLVIKGKGNPITWDFRKNGNKLIATTTLFSSDYGIHIKKERSDNKVNVRLVLDLD